MALLPDVKYLLEKKNKAFVVCDSWRVGSSKSKEERRLQGRARRALGPCRPGWEGCMQPWWGTAVGWWRKLILGTERWGMELTLGQVMAASFLFLFCVRRVKERNLCEAAERGRGGCRK